MDIKIIVATHKKYRMPEDEIYLPVHVGREGKKDLGFQGDNTGDNISLKNPYYCELTGLYWAWKNLDCDYAGLVHYRRHFSMSKKRKDPFENVLNSDEAKKILSGHKIIVPKKRKYYIETLYSHYAHTHYAEHLDITKEIISKKYPEYLKSCSQVYSHTYGYMFNMMIMRKDLFDSYCEWLFDILSELERTIGSRSDELSFFQGRFYGRVSEIIFNVWLDHMVKTGKIRENEIFEMNCIYMEKINMPKKITSFLKAKIFHKRYEGSF
ncbi:MAG: DUF4422 domain-containing protein [Porcipelethomonas sp.]